MRQINTLVIFAVIAIILLIIGGTTPVIFLRDKIQLVFGPIARIAYQSQNQTSGVGSTIAGIGNLVRENAKLKSENEILQAKVTEMEEVKRRVATLEKEIGLEQISKDRKVVAAAVVGRSPSSFRDILTIDKGSQDGLSVNQPAISNGFLIGKVVQVFPTSSQIELITSSRFLVPVILQDSRALGLLKGGIKGIQIEQLPVDTKISQNEKVITSGLAGQLPSGIPIGSVKEITSKPSDIFQTVSIESSINLSKVEIVLILVGTQ